MFHGMLFSTFKHFGHFGLVRLEFEGRQETQRAEVERHDRRHTALQEEYQSRHQHQITRAISVAYVFFKELSL